MSATLMWSSSILLAALMSYSSMINVSAVPMITVSPPGPITVAEGNNVELKCRATGNETLTYQWMRESGSLPNNTKGKTTPTFTICNITVNDSGLYYCDVNNNGGASMISMKVQVTVKKKPSITVSPGDQELGIISNNDQVTLTCKVTGDDIAGGYWERMDDVQLRPKHNMSSVSNDKRTITVTITRARPEHSGMYYCVAYSQWGVGQSRNVQVTITIAPPMITTQLTNKMITALQNVTFTCEAKGFEVKYEWRRHSGRITFGNESTHTISQATPLDSDQYYCVAMTEGGYAFSNNVTLTVNGYIDITSHPQDVTKAEGDMLSLSVIADGPGKDMFTYQWKKSGSSLPSTVSGKNSPMLTIRSVKPSDSGSYHCIVMNRWKNMTKSNEARVNVLYIMANPTNVLTLVGTTINLTCEASGVSKTMYQWMRKGDKNIPSQATGVNTRRLTIPNSVLDDSGQYKCDVSSDGASVSSEYGTVTVLMFKQPNSNVRVTRAEGSDVVLTCEATGAQNLMYDWKRMTKSLPSNVRRSNGRKTLTIPNIKKNDEGQYYCEVSHGGNNVSSMIVQVIVKKRPSVSNPSDVQLSIVSGDDEVVLSCTVTGDDIIGSYWEKVNGNSLPNKNNISSFSNNKGTLTITKARPGHAGMYRCVAYSQWGVGQSRNVQVTITIAPPVMIRVTRQPRRGMIPALQDVTFTCQAKGFKVKYEWKRHQGSVTDGKQSTLTISEVTPSDSDQYYCVAITEGGYAFSNNVTLTVDDKLSIQVTPNNQSIGEGGTAQFTARASGINMNNFEYQWKKRGKNGFPDKVSGVDGTVLIIRNVVESDEGLYYCTVTNEWDRKERSSDIMLIVEAGKPAIKRHPKDQIISNNQKAIFDCFVGGSNSSLTVIWEKNQEPYSLNNVVNNNTVQGGGVNSILTINRATVEDGGKYRCIATNADGISSVSDEAELIIIPEIITHPNDATVLIGQSKTLMCSATGTTLVYHWIKDGMKKSDANSDILEINNIMESDEGIYRCGVSNEGGNIESNPATITVYGPPVIKELPKQLHAVLGEQFQITCIATNDQDAPMNLMFSWRMPNRVQPNITTTDEDNSHMATSTHHISTVTHDHRGRYKCTVSNGNDQGNANSVTWTVVVEERSSPPTNFSIAYINITSFELKWSYPKYSNGGIDSYTIYYSTDNHSQFEEIVNVTNFNGTYILDNLRPYTMYSVYITAVRLIGASRPFRPLEGMKSVTLTERTLAGKPEVTTDHVDQTNLDIWIINFNSSIANRGRSFLISLPRITMQDGPFSHFYIIVVINSSAITDMEDITTPQLLDHSMNNSMQFYIAAVVNASQYVQYVDDYRLRYALGAEDSTTDPYSHIFYNRVVKTGYLYFYRVFSASSTPENEIYTNTKMMNLSSPQQSTADGGSSSSSAIGPVIGVIVALLFIIAVIIVVILLLFYYKKNYLKPKEKAAVCKFVPINAGIQLDKKEKTDEDGKPLSSLAATNPLPQETAFSPNSPLPLEVITSVGQPTTLFVELPYADDSEISWKKDGKPVTHPVLADGSLYIANTKLSDQGDYTVTATGTDNTTSENVQLKAVDPIMPTTLSEEHKPVKVEDFPEHIALMQSKKSIQFEEDYESVMIDVDFSQHAAKLHVNAAKNRYKNIIPFDHCRVVLSQLDQRPGSDYINASFVDGYKEPKAYIATQGPVSNTVDDFWRMVWEHNVTTIVMLTRLVEDSKVKCSQYWPESESTTYGDFTVTITKHEVIAKYCIRKFTIEKISDHKSREVCQFHFTAWPDHGVPKYGTDILEFHKRIDKYHTRKDGKPMLVHCSAGVGRTGTFIAIDIEIQRIDNDSLVDVHNGVCRLRFWRNFMVQTVDQYTLIFTALLEYIACGDTSIAAPTKSVQDKVKELSTVDPYTNKTGFEIQFETLTKNSPKEKEFLYSFGSSSKNKNKNRNKKSLPPDASRVHLSNVGSKSDYINACYIDGYRHCKEFLVGPGPMESTSVDFWRMIWENQSHAIVMLGQLKENGEEASFKYWPNKGDRCEYDKLAVETTAENCIDNNVTKRIMKVTHKETSATKTITQLQYVEWPQNSCPSTPKSIIEMIEILERVQRKTANGPITVHCSDGIGRSGTFCALMASMNRFKAEQMVDVFKTIITMRTQRPGLVANAEQYKFIHEALVSMLMCYATYANFSDNATIESAVYENLPSTSM